MTFVIKMRVMQRQRGQLIRSGRQYLAIRLLGVEVTLELLSLVLVAGTTLLGLVAAAGPNSFHQDPIALSLAGHCWGVPFLCF